MSTRVFYGTSLHFVENHVKNNLNQTNMSNEETATNLLKIHRTT